MIYFCPIEKIEARYSAQWWDWFEAAFRKAGRRFMTFGDAKNYTIQNGEFLDSIETNQYKLRQGHDLITAVSGLQPDVVFFADLWNPAVINLAYVRDAMDLDFKIKGCLHAGTWDEYDFLTRKGMTSWASGFEHSLLCAADEIFVATNFHKKMISNYFYGDCPDEKLTVVDWPVSYPKRHLKKKNLVVFPHRLAPEKGLGEWDELVDICRKKGVEAEFVRTVDVCNSKADYYRLLEQAKVAVSCAYQETFGIAMAEAATRGAFCVVPDRLSYRELYNDCNRYQTLDEAALMIKKCIENEPPGPVNNAYKFADQINWVDQI